MGGVLASGERDTVGSFKSHHDQILFAFDRDELFGSDVGDRVSICEKQVSP